MEGGECRAGDGRVGGCHSRGHCCPSCLGVPWERRYRWEKITRELLFNWLELLVPVEIRKRGKAFNDCCLRFQLKVITWPQSLDNTAVIVHFKKNQPQNTTISQFSTQSFVRVDNLVSFKFPAMWNSKI